MRRGTCLRTWLCCEYIALSRNGEGMTNLTTCGAITLQGPHHVAKQSSTMSVSLIAIASLKSSVLNTHSHISNRTTPHIAVAPRVAARCQNSLLQVMHSLLLIANVAHPAGRLGEEARSGLYAVGSAEKRSWRSRCACCSCEEARRCKYCSAEARGHDTRIKMYVGWVWERRWKELG